MPSFAPTRPEDVAIDPREDRDDGAREVFDRLAFAHMAIELVRPTRMRVALCGRSSRLRVEVGRVWGRHEADRWAIVGIPETASRRAIVLAVAALADHDARPYSLDVLLEAGARPGS